MKRFMIVMMAAALAAASCGDALTNLTGGTGESDRGGTPATPPPPKQAETPVANPKGATYNEATKNVTLTTKTNGARIYYTLNGGTPTKQSPNSCDNGGTITVEVGKTLKAVAVLAGHNDSPVMEEPYTLANHAVSPVADPLGGPINGSIGVTLSTTTDGATIYYTLDTSPSDPTINDTEYNSGATITVNAGQTLKAIAIRPDLFESTVMVEAYTLKQYTVTFIANGGTPQPASLTNVSHGDRITAPGSMTNGAWTFGGWYKEASCDNEWVFNSDTVTTDTTLYAKWTATATFNRNGGDTDASPASKIVKYPATTVGTLPSEPGKNGNYAFMGWNTQQGGGGSPFDETTTVNDNIEVYAKWLALSPTINMGDTSPPVKGLGWAYSGNVYTISDGANVTVTGTSASQRRVEVAGSATASITLDNVSITGLNNNQSPLLLNSGSTVTLTLIRSSTLTAGQNQAGINAPAGAALTVQGTGTLTATGGSGGAGIGGRYNGGGGNITINGGTVKATGGGNTGAGIGGGSYGAGGTIAITGGSVTASSNVRAIGAGYLGSNGTFTLSAGSYTWWANDRNSDPGGSGTASSSTLYDRQDSHEWVKIECP